MSSSIPSIRLGASLPSRAVAGAAAVLAARLGTDGTTAPMGLECNRILHGLWQTSGGWGKIDPVKAVDAMERMVASGYETFDLADHYGPAEDLIGALNDRLRSAGKPLPRAFTKWVPRPGPVSKAAVEAAIGTSLRRMRVEALDMLQFHWWEYSMHDEMMTALRYLDDMRVAGRIRALALTNFDTAHVKAIVDAGIPIVSNQVQYSVIDMRPSQRMAPYCAANGISLLTYGTLGGGLITDAWLGRPEPRSRADLPTPSLGKYYNMIRQWGSWELFQELLRTLKRVGDRHGVSIAHVATRFILEQPAVGGVIVGFRAGLTDHADDNRKVFEFKLSAADHADIAAVQRKGSDLLAVIGDCGDEYR